MTKTELDYHDIPNYQDWIWGSLIVDGDSLYIVGDIAEASEDGLIHEWWAKVRSESVGQYTGLKDKNGREIYEGDVLKRTVSVHVLGSGTPPKDVDEYLEVDYKDEYAGFFIGETQLFAYVGARCDVNTGCRCTDVEIVGSVYEDKHLLEVQA